MLAEDGAEENVAERVNSLLATELDLANVHVTGGDHKPKTRLWCFGYWNGNGWCLNNNNAKYIIQMEC